MTLKARGRSGSSPAHQASRIDRGRADAGAAVFGQLPPLHGRAPTFVRGLACGARSLADGRPAGAALALDHDGLAQELLRQVEQVPGAADQALVSGGRPGEGGERAWGMSAKVRAGEVGLVERGERQWPLRVRDFVAVQGCAAKASLTVGKPWQSARISVSSGRSYGPPAVAQR
ncbi:hypothetical protein [Streptomyces sp. CC224B]|uniref:hypothetical protein n=1 Tax=Streptomyces sp. CC224B TaxID=3044571 RepID=UPI0024A9E6AF|nr:hypothetical protein [Streptomyces sp. CC224B]